MPHTPQFDGPTMDSSIQRNAMRAAAIALFTAALMGCSERQATAAPAAAAIEQLTAACVTAMLKSTCQVMTGPAAADAASVVFVAGIGPVDAKAYRELRASGEAMCATIKKACTTDWSGPQCRTARALWPASAEPK